MVAKIEKVKLVVGKKEIELSLDEAMELMKLLDDTFGTKETIINIPNIPQPYVYPYPNDYPWMPYKIWCTTYTNTTGTMTLNTSNKVD